MEATTVLPNLPHFRTNKPTLRARGGDFKFFEGRPFFEETTNHNALSDLRKVSASTSLDVGLGAKRIRERTYNGAGGSVAEFVVNSGLVLQFDAYFKEAVDESPLENHRVRKCKILVYLEDSSMQIDEIHQENSGIPQGTFVKRHQIPYPEGKEGCYTAEDMEIGGTVDVYGRRFHIVDANMATRRFMEQKMGREPGPAIPFPPDRYSEARKSFMSRETGCDPEANHKIVKNDMKVFAEATLGNTVDNSKREGFIKYDRHVLSFDAIWDDRDSLYGDLQKFKVHYFLSDDTLEVRTILGPNSGRDPFPIMLKRGKLPKSIKAGLRGAPYTWRDFNIGGEVNVYQRRLVLVDADAHTRDFYASRGMTLDDPILPPTDPEPPYEQSMTPPAARGGFGSEEEDDDMVSRSSSLIPTAPRKVLGEDIMFRYIAELRSGVPEDDGRRFIVTYFKADRTLVVREPPQRNSGVMGGNFLSRMKVRDESGNIITEGSFYIGSEISINGHRFRVTDADVKTLRLMEERADAFPHSDLARVTNLLKSMVGEKAGELRAALQKRD
ncbi:unnamed protein product, partial [Discosporangium mesarthrocarpum]